MKKADINKAETADERRARMLERLESPARGRGRKNSHAGDVRALAGAIAKQRALGKTWPEISTDLYGDDTKADAIRAAYARLPRTKIFGQIADTATTAKEASTLANQAAAPGNTQVKLADAPAYSQPGLFATMRDSVGDDQTCNSSQEK